MKRLTVLIFFIVIAFAVSANAIIDTSLIGTSVLGANDDGYTGLVSAGFGMNYFGNTYNNLYVADSTPKCN